MKRAIFLVMMAVVVAGLTGCITQHGRRPLECMGGSCAQAPENCRSCNDGCDNCRRLACRDCGGRGCGRCRGGEEAVQAGPPTGTVTYPYYTTRGPRDFLANNPQSIGP